MSSERVRAEIELNVFLKEVSNLNYGVRDEFGWDDQGYNGVIGKCGAREVKLDHKTQKALVVTNPNVGSCADCVFRNHCSASLATSQAITKFCKDCDNFDGNKISCKLVGPVSQAIYADRGICYQASINGVEGTKEIS